MSVLTVPVSASPASSAHNVPAREAKHQPPAWHTGFLRLMPAIREHARICFRRLPQDAREEAIQEAIASSMIAYARLVELGKEDLAYAGPLAKFAVAQVREGRRVGSRLNMQDVSSVRCRRRKGVVIEQLDQFDAQTGRWEELVVEDRRSTPAEIASTRIDFWEWLGTLTHRDRRIAETLAAGEPTKSAAGMFRVTPGRISQLRRRFYEAWQQFHGEPVDGEALAVA